MPYRVYKVKGGYRVRNMDTGKVHSEHTTKKNAQRQLRLLRAVDHGWTPTGKQARR